MSKLPDSFYELEKHNGPSKIFLGGNSLKEIDNQRFLKLLEDEYTTFYFYEGEEKLFSEEVLESEFIAFD